MCLTYCWHTWSSNRPARIKPGRRFYKVLVPRKLSGTQESGLYVFYQGNTDRIVPYKQWLCESDYRTSCMFPGAPLTTEVQGARMVNYWEHRRLGVVNYPPGFHLFLCPMDARLYADRTRCPDAVIATVAAAEIIAYGNQIICAPRVRNQRANNPVVLPVIVARRIKVLRIVGPRSPDEA